MKASTQITLNSPCAENFDTFELTTNGGFCASCQKEVIDFSIMSNSEVIDFLSLKKERLCGRFKGSQLNRSLKRQNANAIQRTIGIASIALLSLVVVPKTHSQSVANGNSKIEQNIQDGYLVKGTVYDEQNLPLAGVNVVLKGTKEGVATDFDGKFEFSRPLTVGDVLVFSYISFEPKEYKITSSETDTIDVTINFDASDLFLMGEISVDEVYSSQGKNRKKLRVNKKK